MKSALEFPSTLSPLAGGIQGEEQGKQATQVRGSWSSNRNIWTSQGVLRYPSREGKGAAAKAHDLAPVGALLSACGDKGQSAKRGCDGGPTLCMSLCLWALPLQWSMLPSKNPLLQSSSSCHLMLSFHCHYHPGLALQTADPSTQTLCAPADAHLRLGRTGR